MLRHSGSGPGAATRRARAADATRQRHAEAALAACLDDPDQLASFVDPALCHGWAGLAATVRCAARDARFLPLDRYLPVLVEQMLDCLATVRRSGWRTPGLIDGTAGIAAVLHALATGAAGAWEPALLLDLPPAQPSQQPGGAG